MLTKISLTHFRALRKFTLLFFLFLTAVQFVSAQIPVAGIDGKSNFKAKLMNIEAATNEVFRYTTTLHNGDSKSKVVELKAQLPVGWMISYKVDGSSVTSVAMDAGKTQDIFIEINSTAAADPGKYKIPVKAVSSFDTLTLNLEAVVKGSYGITLTTPTGRLSDEVTAGSHLDVQLVIKNSGTLPLNDISFSSQLPANWEASFEPQKITRLEPGKSQELKVKLKVPDKTIAGDYAATFTASNSNGNSPVAFRIIVKTSLLSGWIGIMVILLSIGLVYILIRKYGRR